MKKLPVLFSVLLMAALLLAACGGANNGNETPGVGTDVVPETGGELDATATVGDMVDPTATEAVATEPVAEATATEAVEPTAEATATEAAGAVDATPTTDAAAGGTDATATPGEGEVGADVCQPNRLTSYLDYEIAGADGENIGEVDGVVVLRDAALVPATGAPDFSGFTAGQYANAQVAYFVVDFDDAAGFGDGETLVPFTAFTALNDQTPVEDCRLVFASSYELEGFPVWDWDALPDFTDENWDNEFEGFWSNLGVTVNTTGVGGQQLGNPVVFRDNFDDINVLNLNDEDLGEIEDFIIDPATGEIRYAVLAAGGFLGIGEKLIPLPMNQVIWGNFDDDAADLGEVYVNHPDDGWENAPEIDLDNVDFSADTWDDEYETYWEGVNVTQ